MAVFLCQSNYNGGSLAYKIFPHPRNNRAGAYLASLYANRVWNEMTYSDQERLWMQALLLEKQLFGEKHRYTTCSKLSLSELYYNLGRTSEAKSLLEDVLITPCEEHFDHNKFYAYGQATWFCHAEKDIEKQIYFHKQEREFLRSCSHFGANAWKATDATIVRLFIESDRLEEAIKYQKEHSKDSQPAEFPCNKSKGLIIDRLIDRARPTEDWFKLLDEPTSRQIQAAINASCIIKSCRKVDFKRSD